MLMRRSFKKLATGFAVAATTSLWVFSPVLEVKATPSPSPGEDWAYATNEGPCSLRVSVSDNVVDNTIRIQVVEGNTCPISDKVFLFIQDGRPQPLGLPAILTEQNLWVVSPGDARPGRYRVMGISPTPSGIGDYTYVPSRALGIDQVITIGSVEMAQASTQQPHPVASSPKLEEHSPRLPPSPRQEVAPERSQYQGKWITFDLRVFFNCLLNNPIRFNGWIVDLNPLKACLPR